MDERTSRVHLLGSSEDRPTGATTGTWRCTEDQHGMSRHVVAWQTLEEFDHRETDDS